MAAVSLIVDLDMAYIFMAVVSKSELHVVSLLPAGFFSWLHCSNCFLNFFSCRNPAYDLFWGVFSHFGILSMASFYFQVVHMQMAAKYSVNSKLVKKYD